MDLQLEFTFELKGGPLMTTGSGPYGTPHYRADRRRPR
jgi:hypothetical protein